MSTTLVAPERSTHSRLDAAAAAAHAPSASPCGQTPQVSVIGTSVPDASTPQTVALPSAVTTSAVPRPAGRPTRPVGPPRGRPPLLSVSRTRRADVHEAARRPLPGSVPDAERLPDPTGIACTVARTALEVLRGERAVSQLVRWVSPDVYEVLGRRAHLLRSRAEAQVARDRVTVRRARTLRLGAHAAEVSVVLVDGARMRAAAARLEVRRGTWRVVALDIG